MEIEVQVEDSGAQQESHTEGRHRKANIVCPVKALHPLNLQEQSMACVWRIRDRVGGGGERGAGGGGEEKNKKKKNKTKDDFLKPLTKQSQEPPGFAVMHEVW